MNFLRPYYSSLKITKIFFFRYFVILSLAFHLFFSPLLYLFFFFFFHFTLSTILYFFVINLTAVFYSSSSFFCFRLPFLSIAFLLYKFQTHTPTSKNSIAMHSIYNIIICMKYFYVYFCLGIVTKCICIIQKPFR